MLFRSPRLSSWGSQVDTLICVRNITHVMPHKSITVSEEAYRALEMIKEGKESFTDAIIRLARRDNARRLLEILDRLGPDEELAASIDRVYRRRTRVRPREVEL